MANEIFEYGPFQVGDVVQLYRQDAGSDVDLQSFVGEEVEVIGALGTHEQDIEGGPYLSYRVRHATGYAFYAGVNELRRRRPPTTGEQMIRSMFDAPPQLVPEVA